MSKRVTEASTLCAYALLVLGACSNRPGPAGDFTQTPPAATAAAACAAQPLTVSDLAGILIAPITAARAVSDDAQTCEYATDGFPAIMISVRPGLGQSTVDAWITGQMPLKASPMAGIGETAAWQASLHEVIAQKRNLLCEVQVRGGASDIVLAPTELPGVLGALCNRIFSG